MKVTQTVSVSQDSHFLFALLDEMHNLSPEKEARYNDLVSHAADRCGPQQSVLEAIFQPLEFLFLECDKTAVVLLQQFANEDLVSLAKRCDQADGTFSMQEKLAAAIQTLRDGSWKGDFPGDSDEEKAPELLRRLDSLNDFERYVLCDILLLLQANDGLLVDDLRTKLKARAEWLVGRHNSS
jgi:hypothetical protein